MTQAISHRAIEMILRRKIKGDVCREGIKFVKEFLEFIGEYIADEGNKRLSEINQIRKLHGQYRLKKIPSSIYLNILAELFKQIQDIKDGDVGNASKNVTTTSSIEADEERWYHA